MAVAPWPDPLQPAGLLKEGEATNDNWPSASSLLAWRRRAQKDNLFIAL